MKKTIKVLLASSLMVLSLMVFNTTETTAYKNFQGVPHPDFGTCAGRGPCWVIDLPDPDSPL